MEKIEKKTSNENRNRSSQLRGMIAITVIGAAIILTLNSAQVNTDMKSDEPENMSFTELSSLIRAILSQPDLCQLNFGNSLATRKITKLMRSSDSSARPIIEVGKKMSSLTVKEMQLTYRGGGMGLLSYHVMRDPQEMGVKELSKKLMLRMKIKGKGEPMYMGPNSYDVVVDTVDSCMAIGEVH